MKSNDSALYQFDAQIREQFGLFCGVDEAGRGPLCGPVCCAAVILDPEDPIEGINDSKKLTEKRRETLFEQITSRAVAYQVVFVSPQEIDEKNILWATMDGMARAVRELDPQFRRRQWSRGMRPVPALRQPLFWQRSAGTAI